MSIRGVWQLRTLSIVHCRSQGSSRGAREFVQSQLPQFQAANPQLSVESVHRNNRHPYVLAEFGQRTMHAHVTPRHATPHTAPSRVTDMCGACSVRLCAVNGERQQIDVKNSDSAHILEVCQQLRNKTGRPIRHKW